MQFISWASVLDLCRDGGTIFVVKGNSFDCLQFELSHLLPTTFTCVIGIIVKIKVT
jgi:hypothetical protein